MISNAQLAQLATKFVTDVIKYKKNKKYLVNLCEETLYESYFNYLLSLSDCLTLEDECKLKLIADNLDFNDEEVSIPCADQLPITINYSGSTCVNSIVVKNPYNNAPYPVYSLVDNSIYHNSSVLIANVGVCSPSSVSVNGGCNVFTCADALKGAASYVTTNYNVTLPTNGYISEMLVYETDATGLLINIPITLNLNPASSPYYSGAGLTTLTSSDVLFSNINWANNMLTLMNNVSISRYGVTGKHKMTFSKVMSGSTFVRINVNTTILNNPSGNLFGINRVNGYVKVDSATLFSPITLSDHGTIGVTGTNFYYNTPVSTSCGNLTPVLDGISRMKVNGGLSNFNKLVLVDQYGEIPLLLSGTLTNSCSTQTLTAVYLPTNVIGVSWKNPANAEISTSATCSVGADGTYTFTATLQNGCVVTKTYVYPTDVPELNPDL